MIWSFFIFIFPIAVVNADVDTDFVRAIENRANQKALEWNLKAVREAISDYHSASDRWAKMGRMDRRSACLREAANLQLYLGERGQAEAILLESIRPESEISESDRATGLSKLLLIAIEVGDLSKQKRYRRELNSFLESPILPWAEAWKLQALADHSYYSNRNIAESIELATKAAHIWRSEGNVREEAYCLLFLAYAQFTVGSFSDALSTAGNASLKFESLGDTRGIAFADIAIGHILTTTDDKEMALRSYKKAEDLFPSELDRVEQARLANGLGHVYEGYGRFDLSLMYRTKALSLFKTENHVYGEITSLTSAATLNYLIGNNSLALEQFAEASKMATKVGDSLSEVAIAEEVANYSFHTRDYSKAKTGYLDALQNIDGVGLHRDRAVILNKLGRIYLLENDLNASRDSFVKSIELSKRIQNRLTESDALYHLSLLERKIGNTESALKFAFQAVEFTDLLYQNVSNSSLKTSYLSSTSERYGLVVQLMMAKHRDATGTGFDVQALEVTEKARARSLLEKISLVGTSFVKDAAPETVEKEKEIRILLNLNADRLIDDLATGKDVEKTKKLEDEIKQLENRLEEINAAVKVKSPVYSAIKDPEPFDVGEFQAKVLDENSVLLEYSLGREESYLWVVGKTEFDSYVLPPRERIESRIEKLRGLLDQNVKRPDEKVNDFQNRVAEAEAEYLREARALSVDLLGQAADKLAGKRLIVVADGKIHYFPLGALPFPNSTTDDPILLTNEVIYEPSAAALMLIKNNSSRRTPPQKDLFLVSDPVFSRADERLGENGGPDPGIVATVLGSFRSFASLETLPRLPASMDEANSITEVVGPSATTARSGFAANRENVLNAGIADYKVVHFATHGLLDEKRPELSGIVLSLFDESGKQQNGGFIRLQDVYGMNLNADLVVLSACDTGLGKEIKGEGLMSLNNAFLQVGAKSVVSSLWRVEDTATKQLMTDFYHGMTDQNLTSSEALRQAQIKLYKDPRFSSPFYWASFTAQGSFSTAPQFSGRNYVWIYLTGLVLVSFSGFYWLRRARNRKKLALATRA